MSNPTLMYDEPTTFDTHIFDLASADIPRELRNYQTALGRLTSPRDDKFNVNIQKITSQNKTGKAYSDPYRLHNLSYLSQITPDNEQVQQFGLQHGPFSFVVLDLIRKMNTFPARTIPAEFYHEIFSILQSKFRLPYCQIQPVDSDEKVIVEVSEGDTEEDRAGKTESSKANVKGRSSSVGKKSKRESSSRTLPRKKSKAEVEDHDSEPEIPAQPASSSTSSRGLSKTSSSTPKEREKIETETMVETRSDPANLPVSDTTNKAVSEITDLTGSEIADKTLSKTSVDLLSETVVKPTSETADKSLSETKVETKSETVSMSVVETAVPNIPNPVEKIPSEQSTPEELCTYFQANLHNKVEIMKNEALVALLLKSNNLSLVKEYLE